MPLLRLAISAPLRRFFDYLPPEGMSEKALGKLRPGCRVAVPFGSREICGFFVELAQDTELAPEQLKRARRVLDEVPLISPALLELCRWAANYYKHPLGEVFAAALPASLRSPEEHRPQTVDYWRLTVAGGGLPRGALKKAPRQAALLETLRELGETSQPELRRAGFGAHTRRQLADKGLIERIERTLEPRRAGCAAGPDLGAEQADAVEALRAGLGRFGVFLLDGVTGSGKTEVYLRVVEQVLKRGGQALVLVPEIGLTPQILSRFERRFDADIAVLHSGLAEGARRRAWEAARSGRAHIVIGTRSAIFCSLRRPGLIVVDEEHDMSFKQQDGFRYSARDLAVKRGQLERVPVLLGSATPSLESLNNALTGRYRRLHLSRRASGGELPEFSIVDVRLSQTRGGLGDTLLGAAARELAAGNQVLLFLNRRGYAPILQCHDCGFIAACRNCDARMTLHARPRELRCHHCEWRLPVPGACPRCGSRALDPRGIGTEQTESALEHCFPGTPVHRVDRDSMRRRGAMEAMIASVNGGEPCILLGTQMLTKGHHFPNVTLVGLIDTDGGLFSADFRGAERMGQLLTQVGGRAGRAGKAGRVMLQTHYPDHPLLTTLLERGYADYAETLLAERRRAGLPPYGHLLLIRSEAGAPQPAEAFLESLRASASPRERPGIRFVGPLPAPLQKKSGKYRAQMLVVCNSRSRAQDIADGLVEIAAAKPDTRRLRWSVDVDPLDML